MEGYTKEVVVIGKDGSLGRSGQTRSRSLRIMLQFDGIPAEGNLDTRLVGERCVEPTPKQKPKMVSDKESPDGDGVFWSRVGTHTYRHHVSPRNQLFAPQEESFPIPLKYN